MPAAEEVNFGEWSAQMVVGDLSFHLWNSFIKDIQQMLGQGLFEFQIVCASVVDMGSLPFLEPLPQAIAENRITNKRLAK
jgi:hypothetical protein